MVDRFTRIAIPHTDPWVVGLVGVERGEMGVVVGEPGHVRAFLVGGFAADFSGQPHDDMAVGDFEARRDDGAGGDQAALADDGAPEHGGAHADEGIVTNRTTVNNRAVADDDAIADDVWFTRIAVDHRAILDIAAGADADAGDVAANHRGVPHADVITEMDVAGDASGVGLVDVVVTNHLYLVIWRFGD